MTIPVGKYKAKAVGLDFGTTNQGNDYVAIAFEVGTERLLETWYGYLNEKNADRTIGVLRMMGWRGADLDAITISDLPGWVQVDVREDTDKNTNEVRGTRIAFVNPLSGMIGTPMSPDNRRVLSLRLRREIAAAPIVEPVLTIEPDKDLPF